MVTKPKKRDLLTSKELMSQPPLYSSYREHTAHTCTHALPLRESNGTNWRPLGRMVSNYLLVSRYQSTFTSILPDVGSQQRTIPWAQGLSSCSHGVMGAVTRTGIHTRAAITTERKVRGPWAAQKDTWPGLGNRRDLPENWEQSCTTLFSSPMQNGDNPAPSQGGWDCYI